MVAVVVSNSMQAEASDIVHPTLALETPRGDTPIVLDGTVHATVQLADRVIVAGEFGQVESFRNGPVVTRTNIMAYDINTGALIDDFAPVLDGIVYDVIGNEAGDGVYIGGTFKQVDGQSRLRVAQLDYDGSIDLTFQAEASAKVLALEVRNAVLYLGGSFSVVNGESHDRIAAVNAITGTSISTFDLNVQGDAGKAGSRSVKALDMHPNGQQLLVVFNGEQLVDRDGPRADHFGIALVDVGDYTVSDWRTDWFRLAHPRCSEGALQLRDGEFSPDGSMFAVVEKGNWRCDKTVAFTTADDGTNDPKWVTAMHDSTFSVAITNNAVYVGGHFCFVTPHGSIDADDAPAYPWVNKPETCQSDGGNDDIGGFAARYQLAALDPETGAPLDWEPVSNAAEAVFHIEPIDRGLLIGQDNDRVNSIRTGRQAFLDFGGVTPPFEPPQGETLDCVATVDANGVVQLVWNDLDDVTSSWVVRRNNSWVATIDTSTFEANPGAGSHSYVIRYTRDGVRQDSDCTPSPIVIEAQGHACSASLVGDDVTLSWNDQPGVDDWQVRRNGSWYASTNALGFTDGDLAPGDYSYVVRYRLGGTRLDTVCTPAPLTVEGEGLSCAVEVVGDQVTISWTAVGNATTYQVRRNGSWLASVDGLNYLDDGAPAGSAYQIRYRVAGSATTVDCA